MKKYLVVGLGVSGKAVLNFLQSQKKDCIVFDDKKTQDCISDIEKINVNEIKQAIVSPGIKLDHPLLEKLRMGSVEIIGEIEFAFRQLKNYSIGITGTNGKTTTTLLIAHVLNFLGKKAQALGNVGTPLTSYLLKKDPDEILVVELSSFQIETLQKKCLDQALILNITPDHLDRYGVVEKYAKAKCHIKESLKIGAVLHVSKEVLDTYANFLDTKNQIKIIEDDIEKAAFQILQEMSITHEQFLEALKTFERPKHRIEFVRKINNIFFYNDSKATNVFSVIYAIKKMSHPIILIAGGLDKGFSYEIWKSVFKGKVKNILAIGKSAEKIKNELKGFDVEIVETLELAVNRAYSIAKDNDAVLLSPGCASYDMFKNYEDRGEKFKLYVKNLAK
ncbi:MAG: UDP-N-acetylmuramoyl-L-alanine--D-glutamate ligase [Chlamydiae bacterium]|nr:UDP-N-acetylmuramoyl-L-alanine--D-glutamate ligase [Chlamydiota bacterium]